MATKSQTPNPDHEKLIEVLKFTPCTYTLSIGGYGGESYAGRVDKATYDYFKSKKIDIEEYATDWDNKFSDVPRELQPFSPGSPYDCDSLFHISGPELSNLNLIQVTDEHGNDHWECAAGINELEDAGVEVNESGGYDFDDIANDEVIFWGGQGEKGSFFEGEIELTAPFDPAKLSISYENCDGWWIISNVEYDGEYIDGSNGYSTTGKWTENKWILGDDVEAYDSVSREDQDEDVEVEEEISTWPEVLDPVKTDWFPADVNPVYVGEYEVDLGADVMWPNTRILRANWTGSSWELCEEAVVIHAWRGLANNPNEASDD